MSQSTGPTIKQRVERLLLANDAAKLTEALRVATNALAWYADERHWAEDDWGCRSVIASPDYGQAGQKARNAIKRIERLTRPERVAKVLRDLGDEDSGPWEDEDPRHYAHRMGDQDV